MPKFWFISIVFLPIIISAQIKFTHYKTEDGLPHDFTFRVYQSDNGYLWIGTDDGLAKFNGKEFKILNQADGFRTNFIIDVKKYNKDTLAVGVWKGGLHFIKNDTVLKPIIEGDKTTRTGEIKVLGKSILSSNHKGQYVLYEKLNGIEFSKKEFAIFQDDKGNVSSHYEQGRYLTYNRSSLIENKLYFYRHTFSWKSYKSLKGICEYEENGEVKRVFPFFNDKYINSFGKYNTDTYYATVKDSFYTFNSDRIITKKKYPFNNNPIHKYAETSYCKVIVVGSEKSGNDIIYVYDKSKNVWQNLMNQIDSKILVGEVYVDRDENIWITSRADGLFQVSKGSDFIKESVLDDNYVTDIATSDKGTVFFLMRKRAYRYNYRTKELSSQSLEYDSDQFRGETTIFNENLEQSRYIKKVDNKIFSYDISCFYELDKDLQSSIKFCANDVLINYIEVIDNELWLATNMGILIYGLDSFEYKRIIGQEYGLKNIFIQKIVYDPERGVWFASSNGLSLIKKNNEIVHFGNEVDLESNKINDIFLDHSGVLWIGTQKGFSIFKDEMFYNFGSEEKMLSSFVSRIVEDTNNQIWISGNKGVVRIDNNTSYNPITAPGLIVNHIKNAFELDVIDYSGKENTIQYRSNITEDWRVIESKVLDVKNYAIGTYTIQFRVRNPYSNWAYSIEYPFQVKQKWYKEIWFISSIAFIITTVISLLVSLQLKKVNKRNTLLKDTIRQSIKLEKELTTVRENVAQDFHDELGNKLAGITVLSELMMKDEELQNSKSIHMITQVRKDAKDLYFGIKDFVWSIDSKSDNLKELIFYLTDFGEELFQNKGIIFKTEKNLAEENIRLPYYWSRQLLLLFKEAMTNSLKHSNATEIVLTFDVTEGVLKIGLSDNGIGFEISKVKRKNGLNNIVKRAKKIGGTVIVKSENGTTIIFEGNIS